MPDLVDKCDAAVQQREQLEDVCYDLQGRCDALQQRNALLRDRIAKTHHRLRKAMADDECVPCCDSLLDNDVALVIRELSATLEGELYAQSHSEGAGQAAKASQAEEEAP